MAVEFRLDRAAMARLMSGPSSPITADIARRTRNVESEAKRLCPVDSGRLRSGIWSEVGQVNGAPTGRVGVNARYALAVHDGSGIYGPRGAPIRPRSGRFLVFTGAGGRKVFAREVKGTRGRPFLRNALPAAAR
jgi:hypothetical protein